MEQDALYEQIALARGRFLHSAVELEGLIDSTISAFFNVWGFPAQTFDNFVLGALGFSAKVQVLRDIVLRLGLDDQFSDLPRKLEAFAKRRNELAHRRVQVHGRLNDDGDMTDLEAHMSPRRRTARGPNTTLLDLEQIERERRAADELASQVFHLGSECMRLWPHTSIVDGVTTFEPGSLGAERWGSGEGPNGGYEQGGDRPAS